MITRHCHVYSVRMARVNITVPDDVISAARSAGLNVSAVATAALAAQLERLEKIAALEAYLADLEAEHGPITAQEKAEAEAWVDHIESAGAVSVAKEPRPRRTTRRTA